MFRRTSHLFIWLKSRTAAWHKWTLLIQQKFDFIAMIHGNSLIHPLCGSTYAEIFKSRPRVFSEKFEYNRRTVSRVLYSKLAGWVSFQYKSIRAVNNDSVTTEVPCQFAWIYLIIKFFFWNFVQWYLGKQSLDLQTSTRSNVNSYYYWTTAIQKKPFSWFKQLIYFEIMF